MLLSGHCSVWELSQATSSKCQLVATAWQPPAAPPVPEPLLGPSLPRGGGGGILPSLPPASPAWRQQDVARHPGTRQLTPSPAVTPHAGSTLPKPKEAANLSRRCEHFPGVANSACADPALLSAKPGEPGRAGQHPPPKQGNRVPAGPGHQPAPALHPLPPPEHPLSAWTEFNLVKRC